jgi:hypothetical protein
VKEARTGKREGDEDKIMVSETGGGAIGKDGDEAVRRGEYLMLREFEGRKIM